MSTTTWTLSKDTTTAGGSVDLGNGNDQHAPMGLWSGFVYRYFAQYAVSTAGMASISNATLHIRSTTQVHCAFGSSPLIVCQRVTSSWTGSGGSEASWSGSASPKDSTQPSTTVVNQRTTSMTGSQSTWDTIDVTGIAQDWLGGSSNYGIMLKASSEATTTNTWEAFAQASSSDSYITVTYVATPTAHAPTVTTVAPVTGDLADLYMTAGSGWGSPRPLLQWAYADLDGNAQASYQAIVYNDSAGSPGTILWDSGVVSSTATSVKPSATFTEGSYYHWKVSVKDSTGLSSGYTATERFRTRWGAAEYGKDLLSTPNSWTISSIASSGSVVIEYNSATDATDPGTSLGTWASDLASVTKRRFFRYRVWLLPLNAVAPSFDSITLSYNAAAQPNPDNWTLSTHGQVDNATRVYGVKSLRIDSIGVDERTYQLISVQANTDYYLHGQMKQTSVGTNGFIAIGTTPSGGELARADASSLYTDWTEVGVAWNSGSNTSIYVHSGASGTGTTWFDALKLEASADPTLWLPSVLSAAVVLDGSGLKIDASQGGSLRIRGSAGTSRDEIKVDAHGLLFGGDSTLYSSAATTLRTGASLIVDGALTPVSLNLPSTNAWTAQATANQGTFTTVVDLTGLTVTLTAKSGHRYLISGFATFTSTVLSDYVTMQIMEGATQLQKGGVTTAVANAARGESLSIGVVVSPTVASHTYKLTAQLSGGTGLITMNASATQPAFILVQDLG